MNRRNLLTGTARALAGTTLAIGGAVAKSSQLENSTPAPDAELIAVCAEFDALERQSCIINGTGPDCVPDDAEADRVSAPIRARMHALLDRMDELRAASPAGIQARAHCLAQHAGHLDYSFDYPETMVGRLLIYLMRDSAALGGLPASTVKPAVSPDAALLEACAAYHACEASRPIPTGQAKICGTPECDRHEEAQEAITERANDMVDDLADRTATTREGMQAKARAILLWDGGHSLKGEPDDYSGDRLMASLLRDVLAGSAGA